MPTPRITAGIAAASAAIGAGGARLAAPSPSAAVQGENIALRTERDTLARDVQLLTTSGKIVVRSPDLTGPNGVPDGKVNSHDLAYLQGAWNDWHNGWERLYVMPDVTGMHLIVRDANGAQVGAVRQINHARISGMELGAVDYTLGYADTLEIWLQ